MQILIRSNPLRLTAQAFAVITTRPSEAGHQPGEKVTIAHPEYGELGIAEVITANTHTYAEVKPAMTVLSSGPITPLADAVPEIRVQPYVQFLTLRFIRRYTAAFDTMIRREARAAGMLTPDQPKLFS